MSDLIIKYQDTFFMENLKTNQKGLLIYSGKPHYFLNKPKILSMNSLKLESRVKFIYLTLDIGILGKRMIPNVQTVTKIGKQIVTLV